MRQELPRNVRHLFVLLMVLYRVLVVGRLRGAELHEVDSNTVVGKGLAVHVADGSADLQELLVLLNCLLVLAQVVVEHPCGVVRSPLVSRLARPFAGESQDFVVF